MSLRLLDRVAWNDVVLPGERIGALLGALAAEPGGLADQALVDAIWVDDLPRTPGKALQVLVSRVRAATRPGLIERTESGYRLSGPVDAWEHDTALAGAHAALTSGDAAAAADLAADVAATVIGESGEGPLGELRRRARERILRSETVLGVALVRLGRHAEALPRLRAAHERHPDDAALLAELLRCEAAAEGPAVALGHYEDYRRDLADRLGVGPSAELQRLHRELLGADDPVRTGLRYDAGGLLGRDDDLGRLRAALATSRLVTVLGPGGIGKTSIAQVLARESQVPRVHVVELVGVATGDDVLAEVGAALGVRGSLASRRTLTPAQQADVRGRIAQELDSGPALLVLDNCEHVLEPVASLVAYLLVTTRESRVLATSRAPLRIAAERVVPLTQLDAHDAADLFCRRAFAVRPGVALDPGTVAAVVERLDGLPLAVELAAARVRTMSVEEVRRGLDDVFELLRSRDRGAPERHRTLGAVIEWSWALLGEPEREALARLSVFHDGFDASAADQVLGPGGRDLAEALVDQSLLVVHESEGVIRFRALETIREFAVLRLHERGLRQEAWAAQDRWAVSLAAEHANLFLVQDQVRRIEALLREENNLTDVLRRALDRGDAGTVVALLSVLGAMWTMTGNHARVFAVADAAEETLIDWDPPAELAEPAREVASILLVHQSWMPGRDPADLQAALQRWGEPVSPWARATWALYASPDRDQGPELIARKAREATDDPSGVMLLLWAALTAENSGDARSAIVYATEALRRPGLTPYLEAALHAELAQLAIVMGDYRGAAVEADLAWPTMRLLHAEDDAREMRIATALAPLAEGDLDEADRILDEVEAEGDAAQSGSRMLLRAARAESALARGETRLGLDLFERAVEEAGEDLPGLGFTPWRMMAISGALVAYVRYAGPECEARASELFSDLLHGTDLVAARGLSQPDLPLNGVVLVALGCWLVRFGDRARRERGVRLVAVAERWAYNRSFPTMSWSAIQELAEQQAPGRLGEALAEYAERPGPDLLPLVAGWLVELREDDVSPVGGP